MKKYADLMVVVMALLLVYGWFGWISTAADTAADYRDYYAEAQEKREKRLYQLAIQNYEAALNNESKVECVNELAQTCWEYYQDESNYSVYAACTRTLDGLISRYPQVQIPYEILGQLYLQNKDYDGIKSICSKAQTNGAASETLQALRQSIVYQYTTSYSSYNECGNPINGCIVVRNNDQYGIITTDGETIVDCAAEAIGPISSDGYYVVTYNGVSTVQNLNGIKYANLDIVATDAGLLSEGLIPIQHDGQYDYYTVDGDYVFGGYEDAGSFFNGLAAVKQDGLWYLVDQTGTKQSEVGFEDLAFTNAGSFNAAGVVIAKRDGSYQIYDTSLNVLGGFQCDEVDLLTQGGFAYKSGDAWGFADYSGNVVLAPQYEEAKSFSNGQATVRQNGEWFFIDAAGNRLGDSTFASGGYLTANNCCVIQRPDTNGYVCVQFVG